MILPFPPLYKRKVVVLRYLLTSQREWPGASLLLTLALNSYSQSLLGLNFLLFSIVLSVNNKRMQNSTRNEISHFSP